MEEKYYYIALVKTADGSKIHCRSDLPLKKGDTVKVRSGKDRITGDVVSVRTFPKDGNPYSAWGENSVTEVFGENR